MKRKSQLHTLETIAVLAVFFILVILGFVFYAKVIKGNVEEEQEEIMQLESVEIAQRASTMPELQCSENNIVKGNCVDMLKLDAAESIIKIDNKLNYFDKLGYSKIIIEQIYPPQAVSPKWEIYDMSDDIDYTHKSVTNIPISIFDPNTKKNSFGLMTVETYTK